MRVLHYTLAAGLALTLSACGSTNTKGSWSCGGEQGSSCSPIAVTDNAPRVATSSRAAGIETTARPVRWWQPEPFVFSGDQGARREGDQVMRIVFAPWVDSQGDLHNRSEVIAVMRRGGWWMPAPSTATASAELDRIGRNGLEK